ncbi:hypothetical protein ACFQ1M_06995 [Sungkyunkwania multivorans]|uniref:Uncharacterized protein n=1 Tax=Sungkyunkwania multivorans TaxID=1173618 RepID=A0ABW3CZ98_9FLAO
MSRLVDYDLKQNSSGQYWLTFEVTSGTAVAYSKDGDENIVTLSQGKGEIRYSKQYFPNGQNQVIVAFQQVEQSGRMGPRKPKVIIDG